MPPKVPKALSRKAAALLRGQTTIPGMAMPKGVRPLGGGAYEVLPVELTDRTWLNQHLKRLEDEHDLATATEGGRPRAAGMAIGALDQMRRASQPYFKDDAARGLMQLDENGRLVGAVSANMDKAAEKLAGHVPEEDLDAWYLDYVSSLGGKGGGRNLLRKAQDMYGDKFAFQVASPEENHDVYTAMGAKPLSLTSEGTDVLGGDAKLPAYGIQRKILPSDRQFTPIGQRSLDFGDTPSPLENLSNSAWLMSDLSEQWMRAIPEVQPQIQQDIDALKTLLEKGMLDPVSAGKLRKDLYRPRNPLPSFSVQRSLPFDKE